MNHPNKRNQSSSRQQQAPSWGSSWIGTFQSLSVHPFSVDLAEELAFTEVPTTGDPPSSASKAGHTAVHHPSIVQEQPTRDVEYSPAELQEKMKRLMTSFPTLWKEYKQELSRQENPNQPETVRRVLVDFLRRHEHALNPTRLEGKGYPRSDPKSGLPRQSTKGRSKILNSSILNSFKESLHGETSCGNGNSWMHRPPQSSNLVTVHPSSGDSKYGKRDECPAVPEEITRIVRPRHVAPSLPLLEQDHAQQRLARLKALPSQDLWKAYQIELHAQENPTDSRTIQIILDEFWKEHGAEIQRQEQLHHDEQLKQKHATSNHSESTSICSTSILQRFSSSYREGELPACQSGEGVPAIRSPILQEDTTQRRLTRLRQIPHLWESFYSRLEQHPKSGDGEGTDPSRIQNVLEGFWEEFEDDILDYEEEARLEAKLRSSSIFVELNTSFHDEKVDRTHLYSNSLQPAMTVNSHHTSRLLSAPVPLHQDQTQKKLSRLRQIPSLWQDFQNTVDQHDDPTSPGTIHRVMEVFWTKHEREILEYEANQLAKQRQASSLFAEVNASFQDEEEASLMNNERHQIQTNGENLAERSGRGFNWAVGTLESQGRTISMRSARSLHVAMEELTGELLPMASEPTTLEETSPPGTTGISRRDKSWVVYQDGEGVSSRSMRSMKLAIDCIAGEVGESEVGASSEEDERVREGKSVPNPVEEGRSRRKIGLQTNKQQSDGFSSRSMRSLQLAIDGLAWEVEETAELSGMERERHMATPSSNATKKQSLPENAKTRWMSVNGAGVGSPMVESQSNLESTSGVLSILTTLMGSQSSLSSSKNWNGQGEVNGILTTNDIDLSPRRLSKASINAVPSKPPKLPPGSSSMAIGFLGRLSHVSSLFGQDFESEVSGESFSGSSLTSHGVVTSRAMRLEHPSGDHKEEYLKDASKVSVSFDTSRSSITRFEPILENDPRIADDMDEEDDALFQEAAQIAATRRRMSLDDCEIEVAADIVKEESARPTNERSADNAADDPMMALHRDLMMESTMHYDVEVQSEADGEGCGDRDNGTEEEETAVDTHDAHDSHNDDDSLL